VNLFAVITGDLANSSKMKTEERDKILLILKKEFETLKDSYLVDFKIFRGDSFQAFTQIPEEALTISFIIKSLLNKLQRDNGNTKKAKGLKPYFNARMAIGLGSVDFLKENPGESDGEAFRNSGLSLDQMKAKGQQVIIKSPWEEINQEFETECKLLDAITDKWLTASAEVIYLLLMGYKEQEIADILKISQSAVNQRKKSANWEAVDFMLNRYKNIVISRK